jgi:hypothetical protein
MNTKNPKSPLVTAQRAYRKAADAYETLRKGSAENPMRWPGERNDRLDAAELGMLDAEIALRRVEAQAMTEDPDVQRLASWLAAALEKCKPALDAPAPAPPILAATDPAALDVYADALVADVAAREAARKAYAAAITRINAIWSTALRAQDLLRKQRATAGERALRTLITSEGLHGQGHGPALRIPYSGIEIDDMCAALREMHFVADTSALQNRRDQLEALIAERDADTQEDLRLALMTADQRAFESHWGEGSATP